MDRQIIYPGQIPLETDLLNTNKNAMIALAKLAAAMFGTATVVNGLACVPTSPASLQVNVNPGEMYSLANVDATAYSSVAADTTHSILKQGIVMDALTLSCPAPVTAGQSVNYLIQASYQDSDQGLVTLPYYNASNPSQAWSGPGNSGAQQATVRKGIVNITAKAGVAATTGSQTTPAPDAGYTGLYVVTVANGQTTITAANITQAANAPILPTDLLHAIQANSLVTANDTGSANTYVVSFSPAISALTDGMVVWFKAKTANTGASTLNVNGLGASPLVGGAHSALQGGEIVANGKACAVWRADISSWVLIECTGGALQVAPATQSNHALQLGQATGRLLNIQVFTASGTYTPTPGMTFAIMRVQGGGGAGAGTQAPSAGRVSLGAPGGAGTFAAGKFLAAAIGASQVVTIGAGGTATLSANGGIGGTSSVGALITAPGGSGGQMQNSVLPPNFNGNSVISSPATGANLYSSRGAGAGLTMSFSSTACVPGGGGASNLGPGGAIGGSGLNGNAGVGYGAGGGGSATVDGGGALSGGAGAAGIVVIEEYA
ncbi:phage tail protein [Cupriavidus necator]|uniref:phage tail protein n=1 Tax=Cupriavidus necator TaxID=106590 RepID=UPI00148FB7B6|nr:phage tail protein [Cupriavidus necator]NOV25881.1 phage tail protein [Cupriavidus necator]